MIMKNKEVKMKNYINYITIIGVFIFFTTFSNRLYSSQNLPDELMMFAQKKGFSQVENFYKRPGMVFPPYVYGYLPGPPQNSAVFWCQKEKNEETVYVLIVMIKDNKGEQNNCEAEIEWNNTYPGGLSIYKNTNETLEYFTYLNDPNKKIDKNAKMSHNAILSEYDGIEVLFYCHNGEWLYRIRE